MSESQVILVQTDHATIRVVEDLVDLLVSKGVITISELPQVVQDRLALRKAERLNLPPHVDYGTPPA